MNEYQKQYCWNTVKILIAIMAFLLVLFVCWDTKAQHLPLLLRPDSLGALDRAISADNAWKLLQKPEPIVIDTGSTYDSVTVAEYDTAGKQIRPAIEYYWKGGKVIIKHRIGYCTDKPRRFMARCPEKGKWWKCEK